MMNPIFLSCWNRAIGSAIVGMLLILEPAGAVELHVDIGVTDLPVGPGDTPNDVQSGFDAFNVDPEAPLDQTFRAPGVAETRVISGVSVSIVGEWGNGAFYTDQPLDVSGPLGDLAEDGVMLFESDLIVTLSSLPAGLYNATLFHHWASDVLQSPFDVYLGVGGSESLVATDVILSNGFDPAGISTSEFQVLADGGDIIFRLDGEFNSPDPSARVYLNGFSVVPVPEPSAWLLLAIGASGVFYARRRKPLS